MADMDLFVGAENQFLICALRNDLCTIICSWFKSWSSIDIQCKYFRIFTLHHFCNSGYHCKPGVDLCVPDPDTRYIMQNWHLIVPIQFLKTNLRKDLCSKVSNMFFNTNHDKVHKSEVDSHPPFSHISSITRSSGYLSESWVWWTDCDLGQSTMHNNYVTMRYKISTENPHISRAVDQ